jgi:serine/threonine protein phosphatase PrpC
VGDSRAILGRQNPKTRGWKFKPLSRDHKPTNKRESERIYKMGGVVHPIEFEAGRYIGPERVWDPTQDGPGIAMSRSFGDAQAKKLGVTWEPTIRQYEITKEDKFLLLASDGLWDAMSNRDCLEIISEFYSENLTQYTINRLCDSLLEKALQRWEYLNPRSIDDITFILVFF